MKKVLITIGVVLLGVVAVGLVMLLPAHLQIRAVQPPLPSEADLRSLLDVREAPVAVRYVTVSSQKLPDGVLGHTVVLVAWRDGGMFMIDAGMDQAAAAEFGSLLESMMDADPARFHTTIADALSQDIDRVRGVGFTHLHIDHTQGLGDFCAARAGSPGPTLVQTPYQRDLHNRNTEEGGAIVAASCLDQKVAGADGLNTFPEFPGLGVVPLGGHTPGSTLFAVAVDGQLLLFSGDITNSKADLDQNRGKGFAYSYLFVPEDTGRTRELREWLAGLDASPDITVVVSHDLDQVASVLTGFEAGTLRPRASGGHGAAAP